jgi:molybdopterin converting factor small subunit
MVTITLMGQLQTADGERDFACSLTESLTVRQLIQKQGHALRPVLQLLKEKKVMVTVNKRIASEDTRVQDGDAIKLVAHDGMGGMGLAPTL